MTIERSGETPTPIHSEEALHEQRELLRVALSSIGDAIIIADIAGCVTFLNPVAQSLTGWTQEAATGNPLDAVFKIVNEENRNHPVESPTIRSLRDGLIVGPAKHTLLIAKDGSERLIDNSAAPIHNAKGEVVGVMLVFRDVTERKRQERQVQDALVYADNIIATLREPFLVLDKNLRVRTANAVFYRNFHVSKDDTEGRFIYELGDGQWNIPVLRTMLDEVLSNHHLVHDFEVDHAFPGLGHRTMRLNASRFPPESENPDLILLAVEDITKHKQAEYVVQTSELRYRRLFESARDGILILDANTLKIIDANPFMTELLGYTHDEFLGKELWEIGFFGDKKASQAVYRELQEKGYVRYDYLPLETQHGKKAEVEFVSNVYQVNGTTVAQCNIRDISERSRLERKTKEQAESLAELHHRKDEFLAMLSHELRNPLAPISNAVQLLRRQKSEGQLQQRALAIVDRQVGQLVRLVDDLLEVSRITTGRIHLRHELVTLNGIFENALETVRPIMVQRRHSLSTSLSPQPILLNGDAAPLEQVVVNLLTNAAKYTDEGGQIWLSVQQEGDEAVLRLRDSGVGIAPQLLPRIFDLFTQAERSLDRSQGGLGIGLCLVQRLVEMHGGKVQVVSALGQGSEFVVRLPMALNPESQSTSSGEKTVPTGPSLRVLVVDDILDVATSLAMLLQDAGHDVRTAHDGPSTLHAALEYRPNVVLLDIGLPGMDGLEVARRLRQQPVFRKVVLVALTGYGLEADRVRSQDAGFDHHMVKPTDFGQLQQILATVSVDG